MRRSYPYFVTDVVLLAVFLAIIPVSIIYNSGFSYAFILVAGIIFAFVTLMNLNKYRDFEKSVKSIKDLHAWGADFFSTGTLMFDYKGEKIRYFSCVGGHPAGYIPVNYTEQLENGSDASFELSPGGQWLGEFSAKGNRKFLDTLRQEITAFNRKYPLMGMSNREGMLEVRVRLDFIAGEPAPEGKLKDMTQFLEDFLAFGYKVNNRLKPGKKRKKRH